MFCETCGNPNDDSCAFCTTCGQKMEEAKFSSPPIEPESTQPEFVQPEFTQPEFVQPEFTQPEFVQPEFTQPEFVQPEFTQPARPKRKKSKLLMFEFIILAISCSAFYFVGQNLHTPEQVAKNYITAIALHDYEKAIEYIDDNDDIFYFEQDILNDEIEFTSFDVEIDNSIYANIVYTYEYKDGDEIEGSLQLRLSDSKSWFLFDNWKVSATNATYEEVFIIIPNDMEVTINGRKLPKYLDKGTVIDEGTSYTVNNLLNAHYSFECENRYGEIQTQIHGTSITAEFIETDEGASEIVHLLKIDAFVTDDEMYTLTKAGSDTMLSILSQVAYEFDTEQYNRYNFSLTPIFENLGLEIDSSISSVYKHNFLQLLPSDVSYNNAKITYLYPYGSKVIFYEDHTELVVSYTGGLELDINVTDTQQEILNVSFDGASTHFTYDEDEKEWYLSDFSMIDEFEDLIRDLDLEDLEIDDLDMEDDEDNN